MSITKPWLIIPGVAIGIIVLVLAITSKEVVPLNTEHQSTRLVEVTTLTKVDAAPMAIAFGQVEPKTNWEAVAEVSGNLVFRHPQLEEGRFLKQGTLLLKIDPLEYTLKMTQAEANLNASKTQITRLVQEETNLKTSLSIERQRALLVEEEYLRKQKLKTQNLISSSELENEKQNVLIQNKVIQELENALQLVPDDRRVLEAQLAVEQAKYEDAKRQLSKTEIVLPFDAKIAEVNIENEQVVNLQSVMVVAQKLDTMVADVQLSLGDMRQLIASVQHYQNTAGLPSIDDLNFDASISLVASGIEYKWPAKVARVAESVNVAQATVGMFLEVEQNLAAMDLAQQIPLTKGMYVQAKIQGYPQSHFVVPERALHGTNIYLMDEQKNLQILPINVLFRSEQGVAISGELHEGQILILNDLIPAVNGMTLRTKEQGDA
ncbi:efflux RND transporter periplasmic adaptor subunit [Agarivorans sp. 1_MG-2023]|uniref:efflux RND transporter periplasmic adaptor subunit n=1 Tax=Agarivorans sp. 1_MG-2023 TaxID=3062634 RepID=UPI0026E33BD1|nr:HlyD family secretion protein [Agarivorans sp. 1_MG-2023]MDO6765297.1 HlyD family secretion protein [Agarivorans sp. 1_MG-2023]